MWTIVKKSQDGELKVEGDCFWRIEIFLKSYGIELAYYNQHICLKLLCKFKCCNIVKHLINKYFLIFHDVHILHLLGDISDSFASRRPMLDLILIVESDL